MSPPNTLADELSGCPSSSRGEIVDRGEVDGRRPSRSAAARAYAAPTPVTIAVAEEPSPRPCGTALMHTRSNPAGGATSRTSRAAATSERRDAARLSARCRRPSPVTVTRTPTSAATVTVQRSRSSRPTPIESNPGPRFALLAGTDTVTDRPGVQGITTRSPVRPSATAAL